MLSFEKVKFCRRRSPQYFCNLFKLHYTGVLIVGSFSLVFTSGVDEPSSFIEIRLSDSRCESQIIETIRQSTRGRDILISSRKHVLLLEFKNSLEAIESHEELLAMTRIQDGFGSLNLVAIADFCQVSCSYHKKRDLLDLQLDVAQAIEGSTILRMLQH